MKSITTLIKLHKRKLDELRRKAVALENQKQQLRLASQKLSEELENEIKLARSQPGMSGFFGGFAKRIQKRQEDIAAEIRRIDKQIETLADEINAEFSELKKFEITRDNMKRRARAEEERKDTILLDEMASQQHRRKKQDA